MLRMLKVSSFLCCVLAVTSITGAQEPDREQKERVLVEEIKMNVSALTVGGHFVSDLKKEDLVMIENGRLQHANAVRRLPANVLIMLDTGGTMRGNLSATLSAAKVLIGSLSEDDNAAVFQIADKPQMIADWTADKATAAEMVQMKLAFGRRTGLHRALREARGLFPVNRSENRHLVLITAGIDSFNDDKAKKEAMLDLLSTDINVHVISYTHMQKGTVPRKREIVAQGEWKPQRLPEEIVASLPDPKRPEHPDEDREITPREIAKMPRLGGVSLDFERLMNARKRSKELDSAESFLETVTADTNGLFLLPETVDEMNEKASALAAVIDSQWVIAYTPKNTLADAPPGEVRNIEITSKRPGVQVQARRKLIVKDSPLRP